MDARPQAAEPPRFVSIKVRPRLRQWLKTEAAKRGVPMYALLEELLKAQLEPAC